MVAPRRTAPPIAIELAVGLLVLEVAVDRLAPRARGPAAGRRLHDDERRLVLLGHLCGRKPGLLQRRVLAEQRLF